MVLAAVTTACGSNARTILYAGVQYGHFGHRTTISDREARAAEKTAFAAWKTGLHARAARTPGQRFPRTQTSAFRAKLGGTAARYGFTVTSLRFYRLRQLAPYVRVRTRNYLRLSRAIPAIMKALDPRRGSSDLAGWSYEGFYFEADDERGIPFAIVSNLTTRGQEEGSQWARSDQLYPFGHG